MTYYQDHITKLLLLRAMLNTLLMTETSKVLQSDNSPEFVIKVITEVRNI